MIVEPFPEENRSLAGRLTEPLLQLYCVDSRIAMKHIFSKYRNVILTSGTLSPIDVFPKLLGFKPILAERIDIKLPRNSINPIIVTKGVDQISMSGKFSERDNQGKIRNYGTLIVELSQTVPDGLICYFTSYKFMEHMLVQWNEMKILQKILENKLIFIETTNETESMVVLENYKKACDNGRGAVLFSVARGKLAHGTEFTEHYSRCVVMFGIPYHTAVSRNLKARLAFL
jgi:DNA excision repair protein ERCC-2